MSDDEMLRDGLQRWVYVCHRPMCSYQTKADTRRAIELARSVHRHRHVVGLAGITRLTPEQIKDL